MFSVRLWLWIGEGYITSSNSWRFINSSTVLPFPGYYSYYPFPKYYGCSANGRNKVIKCITFFSLGSNSRRLLDSHNQCPNPLFVSPNTGKGVINRTITSIVSGVKRDLHTFFALLSFLTIATESSKGRKWCIVYSWFIYIETGEHLTKFLNRG